MLRGEMRDSLTYMEIVLMLNALLNLILLWLWAGREDLAHRRKVELLNLKSYHRVSALVEKGHVFALKTLNIWLMSFMILKLVRNSLNLEQVVLLWTDPEQIQLRLEICFTNKEKLVLLVFRHVNRRQRRRKFRKLILYSHLNRPRKF